MRPTPGGSAAHSRTCLADAEAPRPSRPTNPAFRTQPEHMRRPVCACASESSNRKRSIAHRSNAVPGSPFVVLPPSPVRPRRRTSLRRQHPASSAGRGTGVGRVHDDRALGFGGASRFARAAARALVRVHHDPRIEPVGLHSDRVVGTYRAANRALPPVRRQQIGCCTSARPIRSPPFSAAFAIGRNAPLGQT